MHDDCTQAVYVALLQGMGSRRFDSLMADVDRSGVRPILNRETAEGTAFFRAVDMVKKRAGRERAFRPLEEAATSATTTPQAEGAASGCGR